MHQILIVDDDDLVRILILQHLKGSYETFDTGDPKRALVMTLQHKPHAILLDLTMPGPSGFELCKALSSLSFTQQVPIIIISGRDARNEAFCKSLGAAEYVKKPIDFDRLKNLLKAIVTTKMPKRRADAGVQSGVPLILKEKCKDAKSLESSAAPETVTAEGFHCTCAATLQRDATFEVYLAGEAQLLLGSACIARVEGVAPHQSYRFKFIQEVA